MSPPTDSGSVPADDPLIRGVLEVHSPSDRKIAGIEIKLKALQSVALIESGMHTGTEDSIVFEKIINLVFGSHSNQITSPNLVNPSPIPFSYASSDQDRPSYEESESSSQSGRSSNSRRPSTIDSNKTNPGIFLSKGGNGFEFSILLPSSSPPSERSTYGRVLWILSATAFEAGRANSNLTTERPVYPVTNLNPDARPFILSTDYSDLSPIGSLNVDFSSNNLAVAGGLSIDVKSPKPREGIKIHLVKVLIESDVELETKKQGINHHKRLGTLLTKGYVPPQNGIVAEQGDKKDGIVYGDSLRSTFSEKTWSVEGLVRFPDENIIRATTHPGSSTSIRWSHNLLVQIVYSLPDSSNSETSGLKIFSIRNKIQLPSCCAAHEAIRLPEYQACDSATSLPPLNGKDSKSTSLPDLLPDSPWLNGSKTSLWGPRYVHCICGQPLAELEKSIIPRRSDSQTLVDKMIQSKIQDSYLESLNYSPSNRNDYFQTSSPNLISTSNVGLED